MATKKKYHPPARKARIARKKRVLAIKNLRLKITILTSVIPLLEQMGNTKKVEFYFQRLSSSWCDENFEHSLFKNRKSPFITSAKRTIQNLGYSIEEEQASFSVTYGKASGFPLVWIITKRKK